MLYGRYCRHKNVEGQKGSSIFQSSLSGLMICDSHTLLQCYFHFTDQNRGPKRLGEHSRALMLREENVCVAVFSWLLILLHVLSFGAELLVGFPDGEGAAEINIERRN